MRKIYFIAIFLLMPLKLCADECSPPEVEADNLFPSVKFETSMGDIVVELDRLKAPLTVNNFLRYVLAGHYDGTIIHRVEPEFVIQGGGYDAQFQERPLFSPIPNESGNGLNNRQWSIAMVRFDKPHSATSQFYFNLADNFSLDAGRGWGYAVFGSLLSGEQVLTEMAGVETQFNADLDAVNVPVKPLFITRATLLPQQF